MTNNDEDFDRFCEKAHLLIFMLHWIIENLANRQKTGTHDGLTSIERDLMRHAKKYNQTLDFRFDRGDHLLVFSQFLIVGGFEAIKRHSKKSGIIDVIRNTIRLDPPNLLRCVKIDPINGQSEINVWTYVRRIRNSLSHFRYAYDPAGFVQFEDFKPDGVTKTADFSMKVFDVLDFSYKFGRACVECKQKHFSGLIADTE